MLKTVKKSTVLVHSLDADDDALFPPHSCLLSIMLHSHSYIQSILLFFHTHKGRQHNACEGRDAFSDKEMWWSLRRGRRGGGRGQMGKPYRQKSLFGRRFCTSVFNRVLQGLCMLINSFPETTSVGFAVCTQLSPRFCNPNTYFKYK